jgi:hypothetical protein
MRGWESKGEHLPPGYRLDTSDAASWVLRRPDGTAVARFGVWDASRESVERVARNDYKGRIALPTGLAFQNHILTQTYEKQPSTWLDD